MNEVVTKCPKCGDYLANITSGATCLKGCGGIFPKVDAITDARGNGRFIPRAGAINFIQQDRSEVSGHKPADKLVYLLEHHKGMFVRVVRNGQGIESTHDDSVIATLDDNKLREFVRWDSIDDFLINLGYTIPKTDQADSPTEDPGDELDSSGEDDELVGEENLTETVDS